jgi:serine/threonine-protein kinase
MVASILTDDPPGDPLRRAGVPPAIEAVVRRTLAKKPDDRFASMDDLLRALDAATKGTPPASRPMETEEARPRPPVTMGGDPPYPLAQPAPQATALQRYSTAEVQEILARAVEQQEARSADSRLGFDDLVAAAREVGVEPEVLRQASRDLRARQAAGAEEGAALAAWRERGRRSVYRHVGVWAIVNLALLVIGLLEHNPVGMLKVAVFWGIGVAIHALRTFTAGEDEWREEREKKERKERRKQRRAQTVERALDEGAALLLQTGAAMRDATMGPRPARVADPEPPRVRVRTTDTDAGREQAAEEEAAAAERARGERSDQRSRQDP